MLDANLYFGMVVDMVRAMNIRVEMCAELPDAFVVGIGYPVDGSLAESLHQVMHLRLRDFLPSRDREAEQFIQEHFAVETPVESGDAEHFLQFVERELIPLIDAEYPAAPANRTLMGHSWAADFMLYALSRRPALFQRYVAPSATPSLDDEQAYSDSHSSLPVRLHFEMEDSNEEGVSGQRAFFDRFQERSYTGLTVTQRVIPDCTHCAMVPAAFQSGLVRVFS